MKHITYTDKSLLIGDDAADVLIRYAAVLTQHASADNVDVRAISSDGDNVVATMLLGPGAPLMAETAHTALPEPDNSDAVTLMRERIERLEHAPSGRPLDPETIGSYEEDMTIGGYGGDLLPETGEDRTSATSE